MTGDGILTSICIVLRVSYLPAGARLARAESCVHVYQFGDSCLHFVSIVMCTMILCQIFKAYYPKNMKLSAPIVHAAVIAVLQQITGRGS